jgi:hypothetical protein
MGHYIMKYYQTKYLAWPLFIHNIIKKMNPTPNNKTVYLYSLLFIMLLVSMALLFFLPRHREARINQFIQEQNTLLKERKDLESSLKKTTIGPEEKNRIIEMLEGEKALKYNLTEAEKVKIMQLLNK